MPSRLLLVALCAAAATASAQGGPADFDELPEPAQQRFCGLLLDTVLDRTVAALQADEAGGGAGPLRKRAFVLAELRLANESLLYGSGSERDMRLSQALMDHVRALPPAASRPYMARCVAGAAAQADSLRRDVGPTARNLVVEHFLAQRLPPSPPAAAASPVALPPAASTGGQDAWFPTEPAGQAASSPFAER